MIRLIGILVIFFLGIAMLFSQDSAISNDLLKRAEENYKLIFVNPDRAFQEAGKIGEEANRISAKEAELRAITTQCVYYKTKNDFENMMVTAKSLFQKAESYKYPVYQVIAKIHLFDAYNFNGLYGKAFRELEQGSVIIDKADVNDSLATSTKLDLLVAYSNYYLLQKDYKNQLKYIRLSRLEYEKFSDEEYKQKLQYIDYSNLAGVYSEINKMDSAKYYAELSMSKDKGYARDDVRFLNLSVLGKAAMKEADYRNALSYFKEAEEIKSYKNHLNIQILYDNIIETYRLLNEDKNIKLYEAKRDSLKINISENQNKSLHHLLNEKENAFKDYHYIFVIFPLLVLIFAFLIIRKNRILTNQEKISQQYLKETSENQSEADYFKLLEMLKKNDPAFMAYFHEVFPDFTQKLLNINPQIIQSEIEFCALLKLKLRAKDIARYRYIEPKTVRNKKYLIRKKLNIPKEVDIYQFFDGL